MNKEYISTKEAAKLAGVSQTTIVKHIKAGRLPAKKKEKVVITYSVKESDVPLVVQYYLRGAGKQGRVPEWVLQKREKSPNI